MSPSLPLHLRGTHNINAEKVSHGCGELVARRHDPSIQRLHLLTRSLPLASSSSGGAGAGAGEAVAATAPAGDGHPTAPEKGASGRVEYLTL